MSTSDETRARAERIRACDRTREARADAALLLAWTIVDGPAGAEADPRYVARFRTAEEAYQAAVAALDEANQE